MPSQAELYHNQVKSELSCFENGVLSNPEESDEFLRDFNKHKEQLEAVFFKLKESKSYRRTVGSLSSSCITAATPLLSSSQQTSCLVALDIIQVNIWVNKFSCLCVLRSK